MADYLGRLARKQKMDTDRMSLLWEIEAKMEKEADITLFRSSLLVTLAEMLGVEKWKEALVTAQMRADTIRKTTPANLTIK